MKIHGRTRANGWIGFVRWAVMLAVILAGCSSEPSGQGVDGQCQTGNGATVCTVHDNQSQNQASPQNLTSVATSSSISAYRLIVNLPSDAVINTQSPVQATLSATTDKGYTSTITVTLQPTTSTTQPVAPGDTVYTFLLPNTTQVTDWASTVAANANSSINVSSSILVGVNLLGTPGSYTVTIQNITEQAGLTTVGSSGVSDPGPSGSCPPNKPCPVGPPQN